MIKTTVNDPGILLALATLEPFNTHGALSGYRVGYLSYLGRLPQDWQRTMWARQHVIDYVVWSYLTPIAWHDLEAGWIIPNVRYSATTSKHQSRIRAALTYNGDTYAG